MTTQRLTSRQAADLLGVKIETVYAYASRGLLTSERIPGGRGSSFDPAQVRALAEGRSGGAARAVDDPARPEPDRRAPLVVHSGITLIAGGRLFYRGMDAVELADRYRFEQVAGLLWELGVEPGARFEVSAELSDALGRAGAALPAQIRLTDRLRVAVAVAASVDPLRFDLRPERVLATAATLIAAMVEALPVRSTGAGEPADGLTGGLAARLWGRLTAQPRSAAAVDCLGRTMALVADHGPAVSTVAARVAASARAHPYAIVSAGLGALDGPLHGAASGAAHRLLAEALATGDAVQPVSDLLRSGMPVPGLGHPAYPDGDPRAVAVLAALQRLPGADPVLAVVREVARAGGRPADVDLSLGAFSLVTGMPAEAGEVIFAVARTVGWIAHALEEYREPALRLRARAVYTGPPPQLGPPPTAR